jgi:putative addiction module component (TIGR02574 family)
MARSARELFEEAMRLDPEERATLMRLLIETLDAESEEGVEDAWRAEIERRMAEPGLKRGRGGPPGRA